MMLSFFVLLPAQAEISIHATFFFLILNSTFIDYITASFASGSYPGPLLVRSMPFYVFESRSHGPRLASVWGRGH